MARPSLHPLLHYLRRLGVTAGGDADDVRLLHRFLAERDEEAFAAIVRRYGGMVWSLCVRRLGQTPEAEDAFQATFLVLLRKASSLRGPELLGPWLHGVAFRTALKASGRRARHAAREAPLPEQAAEERPEQVWSDLRPVIDEEVNRLPERYRRPVVLCYLQGLSSEEAAVRLGCAKGTIFSRLSRARDILRRRLAKRGVGVTAGMLAAVLAEQAAVGAPPPSVLSATTILLGLVFAAGEAGQVLPASVASLADGVIRDMLLHKIKLAAVFLLVLGLVASGAGFVVHRTVAEEPVPQPAPAPGRPDAKQPEARPKSKAGEAAKPIEDKTTVLKSRVALAEKCYTAAFEGLTHTKRVGNVLSPITPDPEKVYVWSVRWLQAQRDLSPRHEDQIAALEAHLKRMMELKKVIEPLTLDLMTRIKADEAEWYRLEAELWLAQAKAAKE